MDEFSTSKVKVEEDDPTYDSNLNEPLEKYGRKRKLYTLKSVFNNATEAENSMKMQTSWSAYRVYNTKEGVKKFYRCNLVPKYGPQCSAQLFLRYENNSDKVSLYKTENDHDHDTAGKLIKLSDATKCEIKKLFELRLKPQEIISDLRKTGNLQVPTKNQLNNYLAQLKRSKDEPDTTISMGELTTWLIKHSDVPQSDHSVFVVNYEIYKGVDEPIFRFFISTKCLLSFANKTKIVHADTTYKLIWQGFPVLIIGTTDRDQNFHPFGMAVTKNEELEDYKFLFKTIKEAPIKLFNSEIRPNVLVCDSAVDIQNAFRTVFGDTNMVRMCWTQAKRNIQKRIEKDILVKEERPEIIKDIEFLQIAPSLENFEKGATLFFDKWKHHTEFCQYFKNEWINKNKFWFDGASLGSPSTNNALEAFIKVIKHKQKLRERFCLDDFFVFMLDTVLEWSNEYKNVYKKFVAEPTISKNVWIEGYNWAKLQQTALISKSSTDEITYKVPAIKIENIPESTSNINTFENFKLNTSQDWEVSLPPIKENWAQGRCSCTAFLKLYMCKHLVGLAIMLNHTLPPAEVHKMPIGEKRKRGRPQTAKQARLIQ